MRALRAVLGQLLSLFVEDRGLALAVLAVVVLAAALVGLRPELRLEAGAILLFGCIGVLVANVMRAARR